ncbi:hypothetical protein HAX54_006154 [Datura stramonium]|uniref:Uncharacterized protein n=1 Tax=Datura stramonium TaxID=4076 RepID=A0ABS8TAN5_DATST|nr:hypothetical protein [Datura stramonium]
MAYVVLISQLCKKVRVPLFPNEITSTATRVIGVNKKWDVDSPKSKTKRLQAWNIPVGFTSHDINRTTLAPDLNKPNPELSRHVSVETPFRGSSPPLTSSRMNEIHKIKNHSCTEYGRIPRYGHSGSPSEGNSHTILARAGEGSTGKAPYPYNCLPPTLCHPFHV